MMDSTGMVIDDEAIVARRAGMIDSQIDGELVGLHLESGNCYGFNATATRIWALIEPPAAFGSVCAALCEEFEVEAQTCRNETSMLIADLVREGLAEIKSVP
jgi:hypothetical protein